MIIVTDFSRYPESHFPLGEGAELEATERL